ncbi:MAG: hypothetical protein HYZ14_06565 [Bacteroidetes bacterium]|nr:hypothetical protein [Bacteroidota bacterium]
MTRSFLVLFTLLVILPASGQNITTFTDANNRLYQFNSGIFTQIYYQVTKEVKVSTKYVSLVDSKGDVYAIFNGDKIQVAQTYSELVNTDHLLVVRTASVLRAFDQGVVHLLSPNAISFAAGDSVVLFQDVIGGYLKYYYQNEIHELSMIVGNYPILPGEVGANTFIYKDNAGNHKVFWHGQFYDLMNTRLPVTYAAGQDVVAFNDPQHNTFSAFDNGYIIDLEGQFAQRYKAGDNFIYYQDAGDVHKVVREERVVDLGLDLKAIDVTDSLVIYQDYGATKIWYNEKIYQLFNMVVTDYQTDGGIVAYKNNLGGVSAFFRGKEVDVTNTRVEDYKLVGSTIVLKYGPSSYAVWWNGKIYDF